MSKKTTPTPQVETPEVETTQIETQEAETQEAETQETENENLETERPQRTPEEKQAIYDEMEAARKAACGE